MLLRDSSHRRRKEKRPERTVDREDGGRVTDGTRTLRSHEPPTARHTSKPRRVDLCLRGRLPRTSPWNRCQTCPGPLAPGLGAALSDETGCSGPGLDEAQARSGQPNLIPLCQPGEHPLPPFGSSLGAAAHAPWPKWRLLPQHPFMARSSKYTGDTPGWVLSTCSAVSTIFWAYGSAMARP